MKIKTRREYKYCSNNAVNNASNGRVSSRPVKLAQTGFHTDANERILDRPSICGRASALRARPQQKGGAKAPEVAPQPTSARLHVSQAAAAANRNLCTVKQHERVCRRSWRFTHVPPCVRACVRVYSSVVDCSKYTVEEAGFDISALKTSLIQYFRCRDPARRAQLRVPSPPA